MEDGKTIVLNKLLKQTYNMPENCTDDEEINMLAESVEKFKADWAEAIAIGEYYEIVSTAALVSWVDANGSSFATDDDQTAVDEKLLYDYVLDTLEEPALLRRVMEDDVVYTIEEIGASLYESALLTVIESRHFSENVIIFEKFHSLFGIDTDAFEELKPSKQSEVYEEIVGKYDSYSSAGQAFNELVEDKLPSSGNSGGTTGGGNRGGGSYTAPSLSAGTKNDEATPVEKVVFPDLNEAVWATEAVTYLKNKGVINGDDKGNFNPNKSVTRAEFVKMVVLATGLAPENGETGFNDVTAEHWSASYINAAVKSGLVNGVSDNEFNPGAVITRQDMAVILYRAYKINESLGYSLNFSDADFISDYAKEAVAFLSTKGIINGVGDNVFAPLDDATRAQAAQMLYKALR